MSARASDELPSSVSVEVVDVDEVVEVDELVEVSVLDVSVVVVVVVVVESGVVLVVVDVVVEVSRASPAAISAANAGGAPPGRWLQPRFFPCEAALHRPWRW